jgi:hypothetical protein
MTSPSKITYLKTLRKTFPGHSSQAQRNRVLAALRSSPCTTFELMCSIRARAFLSSVPRATTSGLIACWRRLSPASSTTWACTPFGVRGMPLLNLAIRADRSITVWIRLVAIFLFTPYWMAYEKAEEVRQ